MYTTNNSSRLKHYENSLILNNPKTQLSTNDVPNDFYRSTPSLKQKRSTATHENEQQDSVDQKIETKIKGIFAERKFALIN